MKRDIHSGIQNQEWHEHQDHKRWHWRFLILAVIVSVAAAGTSVKIASNKEQKAAWGLTLNAARAQTNSFPPENLSRGLIALPQDGGKVYLGWRFFRSDSQSTNFNVYRSQAPGSGYIKIATVTDSSNYLDSGTSVGQTYYYIIKPVNGGTEGAASNEARVATASTGRNYIKIPLARNTCGTFNRTNPYIKIDSDGCGITNLVVGDLNGDGLLDYIVRTPTTPYTIKGQDTLGHPYHLEAYLSDGTYLWSYNTNIIKDPTDEGPQWDFSYTVWDLDGDGYAEVITKSRNKSSTNWRDTNYLVILDGQTGKEKKSIEWLPVSDEPRSMLGIAYLDGVNPSIIVSEGNSGNNTTAAYDKNLNEIWKGSFGDKSASHTLEVGDFDGDGKDEIVLASNYIDDNGELIWTKNMFHVDAAYVADFDWDNPGYELYIAREVGWQGLVWNPQCVDNAAALIDMNTGEYLWKYDGIHLHGSSLVADIHPEYPGLEMESTEHGIGEMHCPEWPIGETRIFDARGNIVRRADSGVSYLSWDDDDLADPTPQNARYTGIHFHDVNGDGWSDVSPDAEKVVENHGWVDIFGDFREEYIKFTMTDFYIYTNTAVSHRKKATPMQDRHYRFGAGQQGVGYSYRPFHELGLGFGVQPPCSCTPWQSQTCGGGSCQPSQLSQTRTCDPAGCDIESRCISDPSCEVSEDINLDGRIDILDLQLAINVILGVEKDSAIIARTDVNRDGQINHLDLQKIANRVLLTR